MDNENKKDELFENEAEIIEETTEDVLNAVNDKIAETEDIAEDVCDEEKPLDAVFDVVSSGAEETEEADAVDDFQAVELYEKKTKKNIKIAVCSAVIAIVIAGLYLIGNYIWAEGIGGKKTIVNSPVLIDESETEKQSYDVKYDNLVASLFDKVTGNDVAMTVNGYAIDKDLFEVTMNYATMEYVNVLFQTGEIADISEFDMNAVDEESSLTHLEKIKGIAIESFVPFYALVAEGEKFGIVLDSTERKEIEDSIAQLKETYGDEFEKALVENGYPNEKSLFEMQRIQVVAQKVYEDVYRDVSKYANIEKIKKQLDDDMVTVKHILVKFETDDAGNITDELKAKAKKEAEEVLAKVKKGDDFEKLIDEYNDDPGLTDEGYTFADDGTMVQEFTDASFALEIGETSELVETSYGYHIIKRLERNVTAADYVEYLADTAKIRLKKGVYNSLIPTIDLSATPQ